MRFDHQAPPLLPETRYIANMLGLSVEEFERFEAEIRSKVRIDPSVPQAGLETLALVSLVSTVVSVGLTLVASFLKPRARQNRPLQVDRINSDQANITRTARYAQRVGFDSVQQPAPLQSVVPLVFARRQELPEQASPPRPAGRYGGIRVSTPLIWSQLTCRGGSQFLRAMFLVGAGRIPCVDAGGFALGDTALSNYDLESAAANASSSRLSIYWRENGGRITASDQLAGRAASADPGNAMLQGAPDVFCVKGAGNEWRQDFCYTTKPSASTVFGIYGMLPNNLALRISPRLQPTVQFQTKAKNQGRNYFCYTEDDPQAIASFWKSKYCWSGRAGIIDTSTGGEQLEVGDEFVYQLVSGSDAKTRIRFDRTNSVISPDTKGEVLGEVDCGDIASTVSGRQRTADDLLQLGEMFRAGSCLAVLIDRSPTDGVFISDGENEPVGGGRTMLYRFRVVRAGRLSRILGPFLNPETSGRVIRPPRGVGWGDDEDGGPRYSTASNTAQLFRCATATITLPRPCRVFEVNVRSAVGLRVQGLCNFRDALTLSEINQRAGQKYNGQTFDEGDRVSICPGYVSGVINATAQRYSFWRVHYRKRGGSWTKLAATIGVRSDTSEAIYTSIRYEMPATRSWELWYEPVSSWEVRRGFVDSPLIICDPKYSREQQRAFPEQEGIIIYWTGTTVRRTRKTFSLDIIEPREALEIGLSDDESIADDWGKIAETFVWEEIQSTALNGPEHEVVGINIISENERPPLYDNLSILGLNIRASREWAQFSQFSAYLSGGMTMPCLLEEDRWASSNLYPDILRFLLLSARDGAGRRIKAAQIDREAFEAAAAWCQRRRYFCDLGLSERINLRRWASDVGASMLLDVVQSSGRWALVPAVLFPEDGPVPIAGLFTNANIAEGTFALEFVEQQDRQPIQVSVKWREERARDDLTSGGLFPVEREVLVREADRPDTDPIEGFDASDYCTNLEHAIDFAAYVIRVRRLITHSIRFVTSPEHIKADLKAGSYIRVATDLSFYDEFANGGVLGDGTLVTSRSDLLTPGTHAVWAWTGASDPVQETTLTVNNDGTASPTGILFVKKTSTSQERTYKVQDIKIDQRGAITIEAIHHPTDSNRISLIGKNWPSYDFTQQRYVSDSNWIIQAG
jgi:hypothetical protein